MEEKATEEIPAAIEKRKYEIVWKNVVLLSLVHILGIYGLYILFTEAIMWKTILFTYFLSVASGMGITAGAHRLWSHKTYKAKLPLQIILTFFNTVALQDSVYDWVRDHRMHHKYSETDADPYNSKRGFFFSHVGWLVVRKHPEIKAKGDTIDMSDIRNNPVLLFQKKYYRILAVIACVLLPTYIPLLWGETVRHAFYICAFFRYAVVLNGTWSVNSAAHIWGMKPYDKNIDPVENKYVSFIAFGEGFHNYHHTFPYDYKTAELGAYGLNWTKLFIDAMASIGWAYDLRTVSPDLVQKRMLRTGDPSHEH